MGCFLAVSAIRDREVADISKSIEQVLNAYRIQFERDSSAIERPRVEVNIYSKSGRWVVVVWPEYFNIHDIWTCTELSRRLDCVISTVHVYDDDYWTHVLIDKGSVVDRFCSMPDYFEKSVLEADILKKQWLGNPEIIARCLGADQSAISPYLRYVDVNDDVQIGKAFPDDEFEIDWFWVFVDFWRRVGITYPEQLGKPELRLILEEDWAAKLPESSDPL